MRVVGSVADVCLMLLCVWCCCVFVVVLCLLLLCVRCCCVFVTVVCFGSLMCVCLVFLRVCC